MKTLTLTIILIFFGVNVFAQPSTATMKAKIKSNHPSATIIEFTGDGYTERSLNNGVYKNFYIRGYEIKEPTKYAGITYHYFGSIQYIQNGGSWSFSNFLVGDSWYEGVPEPDWNEILTLLNSDIENYLNNYHYTQIVGDLSPIKLADDPEYHWHTLSSVSFNTVVTYSEKVGSTKIGTGEHKYEVRLYSDGYKKPWKSFISSHDKNYSKLNVEYKDYTSDEIDEMKTLWDIDQEKKAAEEIASLPKVDVKKFESGKQLFYYTHNIIMTEERDVILAYFYKVIDKESCFVKGSEVLMSNKTRKWVDNVLDNLEGYRIAHCQYPTVKEESETRIRFYDRRNRRMLDMYGVKRGDTWMLTDIDFFSPREDEYASLKGNDANCQGEPDLTYTPPRKEIKYEVGDKVTGVFSNGEYNAFIDKKDPNYSNRYFIKLEGDNSGKGYWFEEVNLKQGHVGKDINGSGSKDNSSTSKSNSSSFKVGDVVFVNTTNGKMKATIKEIKDKKALVDFKNPLYDDTWVSISNCSYKK